MHACTRTRAVVGDVQVGRRRLGSLGLHDEVVVVVAAARAMTYIVMALYSYDLYSYSPI